MYRFKTEEERLDFLRKFKVIPGALDYFGIFAFYDKPGHLTLCRGEVDVDDPTTKAVSDSLSKVIGVSTPRLDWRLVSRIMPPDKIFVLVACKHGYRGDPRYAMRTARTHMEFRPPVDGKVRWLTEGDDDLSSESLEPVLWTDHPVIPGRYDVE